MRGASDRGWINGAAFLFSGALAGAILSGALLVFMSFEALHTLRFEVVVAECAP